MQNRIFLLDTNVISEAQKAKPNPIVAEWLRQQKQVAIPFPVLVEIERGIIAVSPNNPIKGRELRSWMDGLLATDFVCPRDSPQVAKALGSMYCCSSLKNLWYTEPQSNKQRPGQDLFIAAVAVAYTLPIATLNLRDFEQIDRYFPLPGVYNPLTATWVVPPNIEWLESVPEQREGAQANGPLKSARRVLRARITQCPPVQGRSRRTSASWVGAACWQDRQLQ
jgi:predicted nucleic acid-binding protein